MGEQRINAQRLDKCHLTRIQVGHDQEIDSGNELRAKELGAGLPIRGTNRGEVSWVGEFNVKIIINCILNFSSALN